MKKLIILASILAIATASQATNIKWGISSGNLDTSLFADGSVIYLMQGSSFAYDGDLSSQTSFSIDKVSGGTIVNNGSDITGTLTGGTYVNMAGESVTPANSGLSQGYQKFFMVAIADDGKSIAYSGASQVNVLASALSANVTSAASGFTVATAAVPEPTTVALLALGLAAVGLKRKVA